MVTPVIYHDIPWRITHPSFCLILTVTFCSFKKLKTTYIIHPLLHQPLLRTYYIQCTWLDATGMGMCKISLVAQMVKRLPTMQETWVLSLGQEDPLEKKMATHSSLPAWEIPWMEECGRLQSMGSQRVGHTWATSLHCKTKALTSWRLHSGGGGWIYESENVSCSIMSNSLHSHGL